MCHSLSPFQVNGTEADYEYEEITLERVRGLSLSLKKCFNSQLLLPKWPYGPWSKVMHYIGNRVPFGNHAHSLHSNTGPLLSLYWSGSVQDTYSKVLLSTHNGSSTVLLIVLESSMCVMFMSDMVCPPNSWWGGGILHFEGCCGCRH